MFQKIIFIFFCSLLLSACSYNAYNPPEWLQGQWQQKTDSVKTNTLISTWTFNKNSISHKTNKSEESAVESNSLVTVSEIKEPKRYILRTENVLEKIPYFQVFKYASGKELIYYDSTLAIPEQKIVFIKK